MMRNCAQFPVTFSALANAPPSTLYCTTEIGACGLVADARNGNRSGSSRATVGVANGPRLMVGAIGGNNRTMNVVETFSVEKLTGPSGMTMRNLACALIVTCTIDPQGVDADT